MKRMISQGLVVLVLIANPLVSLAQKTDGDIKTMLQKRDTEIKELLGPEGNEYTNEQREELKNIINGVIDFEAMSREALEETFDTINTEQRTEFIDLFSTIVRDQSLNKLDIYRAKVTYETITVNGELANVVTLAELEDVRTPVSYEMEYKNAEWVITDMTIDDVSTAESYNKQFQRIIKRRGFEPLLKSLRKRAAKA